MSLTAFNRIRRMQQVEEMKPENINKQEVKEEKPIVPEVVEENNFKDEPLVPEEETKTTARRNNSKKK